MIYRLATIALFLAYAGFFALIPLTALDVLDAHEVESYLWFFLAFAIFACAIFERRDYLIRQARKF